MGLEFDLQKGRFYQIGMLKNLKTNFVSFKKLTLKPFLPDIFPKHSDTNHQFVPQSSIVPVDATAADDRVRWSYHTRRSVGVVLLFKVKRMAVLYHGINGEITSSN